jgi:N4-gp56 family major capsid protein
MATNPNWQDPHLYNDPHDVPSTVGPQIYTQYHYKRALVEAAKEQFFGQLADTTNMPKHFGKTIKLFHYLPILDDRNMNDQGIDADGVYSASNALSGKTKIKVSASVQAPLDGIPAHLVGTNDGLPEKVYFEAIASATADGLAGAQGGYDAALAMLVGKIQAWFSYHGMDASLLAISDAGVVSGFASAQGPGGGDDSLWTIELLNLKADIDMAVNYGNLYGSSKDIGTIVGKLPVLSETGGRVNRVGMKRLTLEGTIDKFGFFEEYSQDSLDFDNDPELEMHITTEAVKAANEITEDQLQLDLLNGAGVIRYTGTATTVAELAGGTQAQLEAGTTVSLLTYDDLIKLGIELDNNRTPKNTKVITGSRMIDTRVINGARFAYIGSELLPTLMRMTDYHGEKAWIPVAQYGAATQLVRGEVGSVGDFRFIVVPEMMHWDAAGAAANPADEVCYWSTDEAGADRVNVYPILVVGDGSFTTIGFQTDGKSVKFKIKHVKPGSDGSYSRDDPYGEIGYYSIKWWYGFMTLRPERLAVIKTVAVM